MFGLKKEKDLRFKVIHDESQTGTKILVDKKTGINYLAYSSSSGAGSSITVLIDQNGKPIVSDLSEYIE